MNNVPAPILRARWYESMLGRLRMIMIGRALEAVCLAMLTTTSAAAAPFVPSRATIHALIADHTRIPYSNAAIDTWDLLSLADEDPHHPGNVLTIYGNGSYPRAGAGNSNWEHEHLWPTSYGLTNDKICDYVYTDLHHLRPSEPGLNESRSNKPFGYCLRPDCSPKPLLDGSGRVNRTWGQRQRWHVGGLARAARRCGALTALPGRAL